MDVQHPAGSISLFRGLTHRDLAEFIRALVADAAEDGGTVHAVVLPELALNEEMARGVARSLARDPGIELFVSGVQRTETDRELPRNVAYTLLSRTGKQGATFEWWQPKHHRWKIDRNQLERYGLGHVIDCGGGPLWEGIDVTGREVFFDEFRRGAVLSVLICEDLARVDPVQPVIRAVGPNLVIALLMDGPQLKYRWSAQYAMLLADDPGCSVLTLSPLGMLRRTVSAGAADVRQIALWREPGANAVELCLPDDARALVVSLAFGEEEQRTLDGRSDSGSAVTLSLSGCRAVKHASPPDWVGRSGGRSIRIRG